ncbi:MAG: NAD(P)H-hydrate dehydratase [Bdellovibrionaceae bacterium]|nr:NAD(P)H-hydrate dehydratase [Pseudobdellovibrionaceae bacterium]
MIRVATAEQAKKIDAQAQAEHGLPARQLMNTAGRKAAEKIKKLFPDKNKKIVIFCGPGNNGGDGIVVYRELLAANYLQVQCFFIENPKSQILIQQTRMISKNIPLLEEKTKWPSADVYVDALLGIGINKEITGTLKVLIEKINDSRKNNNSVTISLDIPTGLCSDTGTVRGACIEADHTITFGVRKLGQWIQEGPRLCGKVYFAAIGFPKPLIQKIADTYFVFTQKDFLHAFPQRESTSNKSDYGHVKVWAGSPGMWGAAILTARAAYRVGAGYVSMESNEAYFADLPEVLVEKKSPIDTKFTYAVGPGWSTGTEREKRLLELVQHNIEKVILDADALNTVAQSKNNFPLKKEWILTPHTKELSRLLNIKDTDTIEHNRPLHARQAAKVLKSVVLLKGYRTLIAVGDKVVIIPTGNAALAKAGSGDVLTGLISGLRAQNLSAPLAAMTGAYLHGLMSDIWISKNHGNSLTPSDLLKGLPRFLKYLSKKDAVGAKTAAAPTEA